MTIGQGHERRLPVGAEVVASGNATSGASGRCGVHFRVAAPARARVEVLVAGLAHELRAEGNGYFEGFVEGAKAGDFYRYKVDGKAELPDTASRFQPEGPHGPSQVVDPGAYEWGDAGWKGASIQGAVVYELHIGTFTRAGTFASAARELARLADLGVTLVEVMPIAEFPGAFGWGYDGVDLFAPAHVYGQPDDFRRFVDEAHRCGLGVILDVVYNHFGPDGCYLREFSDTHFTDRYVNDWGDSVNYDGDGAGPVRELAIANAGYWIDEFHLDGLRLDATQSIHDASRDHVVAAIARRAREAAGSRSIVLIGENESQETRLVRAPAKGGYGLDALWNDDFHHSAIVAATGHSQAYYSDARGTPQELVSAVKWGFLFQGQRYAWQKNPRGTPGLDLPSTAFVTYLENHDQVANSARGKRLHQQTTAGRHRALVALTLLSPQTPMLFQGEEFASSAPFLFFADHQGALADAVKKGRAEFLAQFPDLDNAATRAILDDPAARSTFERCKLDPEERARNTGVTGLYRDLLRLRRSDPAFASQRGDRVHGTVIGPEAFALRFLCEEGHRLLVVNLGTELRLGSIADPLVAPPHGKRWEVLWSSEDPAYGGDGVGPCDGEDGWRIGGHQATVLAPPREAGQEVAR